MGGLAVGMALALLWTTFKNYCSAWSVFSQKISPLAHLAHFDLFCGQPWSVKNFSSASRTITGVKAIGLKWAQKQTHTYISIMCLSIAQYWPVWSVDLLVLHSTACKYRHLSCPGKQRPKTKESTFSFEIPYNLSRSQKLSTSAFIKLENISYGKHRKLKRHLTSALQFYFFILPPYCFFVKL